MEPVTIFALAVAFIGVFHMLSTAVNTVSRARNLKTAKSTKIRSDWYCFFKISDLTGEAETAVEQRNQQSVSDKRNDEQKRQQQLRRPRLQA